MTSGLRRALWPLARNAAGGLLYGLGVTRPGRAAAEHLTLVTFHRVLPEEALREYAVGNIAVTVDEFAWFVDFFRTHYTCDTLAGAHRRFGAGERPARPLLAITFDDGQRDNFDHARPVLERAGVPGTFFVPVDAVETGELLWHDRLGYAVRDLLVRDRAGALRLLAALAPLDGLDDRAVTRAALQGAKAIPLAERLALVERVEAARGGPARPAWDGFMDWPQLRTLAGAGHEIGSHSLSHPILTGVDDAQLEREVAGSRSRIEAALGVPCESFCYPNGDADDRVRQATRRAGYLRAVTTTWGANAAGADPMALRRCDIQGHVARAPARLAMRLAPRLARFVP